MKPSWRISHAQGYLGLGMVEEAAAELDHLPPADRERHEVLLLRAAVLQEQKNWAILRDVAYKLVLQKPDEPGGWITWAYATRRALTLVAAEFILLDAERRHPDEPTIQFNLGCYACLRGDLAEARRRVDRAIAIEKEFAAAAATDPDLAALRGAAPG
jgi:Flp pilus assembly protein TadD